MERARLLFGQYRKGEANDPETYTATVAAILAQYPMETIRHVTDPITGLATNPIDPKWTGMPDPAHVKTACENHHGPTRRMREREEALRLQLEERERLSIPDYRPLIGAKLLQWNEEPKSRPIGRFEKPGDTWNRHIKGD